MSRADEMKMIYHKKKFEVYFSEGIPDRDSERRDKITYPEELLDKKCGGCVRCRERDHAHINTKAEGYHCTMRHYEIDITPEDKACVHWWDAAEEARLDKLHEEDVENRRKGLWAIYEKREPVKLPIIIDEFGGRIPQCPICGEMPNSIEQCYWCGQRFIQDDEIKEYSTPDEGVMDCWVCGAKDAFKYVKSKYNGHIHGECTVCGVRIIE